ncbi:unnamed protein product [Rotaria sordida]|uniref:3CxxC-type domain-containing protein n=1 Tax=Rotaria sordida TaxID=392033 RepID=A0A813VP72_9BILA|nr:unnamed protein product [Rotaria sordida]CAF0918553.1 unnamed protein product [Rotaria sordida]CAF3530305.1 unnamed protein product [Rotaria sordida]CAF3681155.1 unnamed protein product [Rotaria sordida]
MTGSLLLHRQHSSAAGYSSTDKMTRSKLRRWSSAENHNIIEITSDNDHRHIGELLNKHDQITSDNDSGIEDFDQQAINLVPSQSNNIDDDEPSTQFGACDDEDFEINQILNVSEQLIYQQPFDLYNDVCLAANVTDSEKKNICSNACEIFHGEFARDIICPLAINYPDIQYYLFSESEVHSDPCKWPGFAFVKLDNAKAQFKCPNTCCGRLWTSMRARISFKISRPQSNGFVILKIFGQICQQCETVADPLWYTEEICRVMKNLTQSIFNEFFPKMIHYNVLQGTKMIQNMNRITQRPRHDPNQRIGKMRAPHDKFHCEACQHGLCFI